MVLILLMCSLMAHGNKLNQESCSNNRYVVAMNNGNSKSTATPAKFRSLIKYDVTMWYDDGEDGAYLGELKVVCVFRKHPYTRCGTHL